jgi:nucleoporin NUP2
MKKLPSRRSSPNLSVPKPQPPASMSNGTSVNSNQEADKQRYLKFRGLNVSALDALQDLISKDAFVDLSEAFAKLATIYKQERSKIEGVLSPAAPSKVAFEFKAPAPQPPAANAFGGFAFSQPAKSEEKPAEKGPALPTPPASFSFAGSVVAPGASNSTSSSAPATGGFVFDASKATSTEKSAFSFPPQASIPEPPKEEKKAAPVVPSMFKLQTAQPAKPSPLRMATSLDSSPTASPPGSVAPEPKPAPESPSPAVSEEKPKPNPFSSFTFGSTASAPAPKPTFTFGSTPSTTTAAAPSFPSASAQPGSLFSFNPTSTSSDKPATTPAFSFGAAAAKTSPTSVSFGFGSTPAASSKDSAPAPTFSFGSATPPKEGTTSSFGSTAFGSSSGNVGFSFGNAANPFSAAKPADLPAFAFKPPAEEASAEGETQEPPVVSAADNPLLAEGEGEQDEDTVHEARAKLFVMEKDEAGAVAWKERGVGLIKVKTHKETGKTRLLGRHVANGRVTLNFLLYPTLKISKAAKTLSFVAFDELNQPLNVRLRLKDDELAQGLQSAIESKVPVK